MKLRTTILFFILEMISGALFGIFGTRLVFPNKPILDLNFSIILTFIALMAFAVIGIGIPGFFHSRMVNKNKSYRIAIVKATLGVSLGIIFGVLLSTMTSGLLPYEISSYLIPILIPILFGVIGFNMEMKTIKN